MFCKALSIQMGLVLERFYSVGENAKQETEPVWEDEVGLVSLFLCPGQNSPVSSGSRGPLCPASWVSPIPEGIRCCLRGESTVPLPGIFMCRHGVEAMFCSLRSARISWTVQINTKRLCLGTARANWTGQVSVGTARPSQEAPRERTFLKSRGSAHRWTSWSGHPFLWNILLCTALQNRVLFLSSSSVMKSSVQKKNKWEPGDREVKVKASDVLA